MQGRNANIDRTALEQAWYDTTVSIHDIAIDHGCTLETVRKTARDAGLPPRSVIVPERPLWEECGEDGLEDAVIERAARVRATWTDEDEFRRRVTKGTAAVSIVCLSDSGDASTFMPTSVPSYMIASPRTGEQVYRDRQEGNTA